MGLARIRSGDKEVLASGTVISFDMNPVQIELPDNKFKLVLEFQDQESNEEPRINTQMMDQNTLKLVLFNFKNSLGTGTTSPIQIGSMGNRPFYLNFLIYTIGKTNKMIHYTFFLGGA